MCNVGLNKIVPLVASPDVVFSNAVFGLLSLGYSPVIIDPAREHFFKEFEPISVIPEIIDDSFWMEEKINNFSLKSENKIYFMTSGSTGEPHLVEKTTKNLFSEAKILKDIFSFNSNDKIISSVPLCHIYGFLFSYLCPKMSSSEIFHALGINDLIRKLKEMDATILITIPSILESIIPFLEKEHLSSLRLIVSSGSKLKDETSEIISGFTNARIADVYGSTETGGIAIKNHKIEDGYHLIPKVKIKLDPKNRILVKSPFVSEYFFKSGNRHKLINNEGFFESNDIGIINNNILFVIGRNDRIVKVNGKRIHLEQVENELRKIDLINEVIVSFDDNLFSLFAFVLLNEDVEISKIKAKASEILPHFMLPKKFIKLDSFPKTYTGKINYKELNDKLIKINMEDLIKEAVIISGKLKINSDSIENDKHLVHYYNFDSISYHILLAELERKLKIVIPTEDYRTGYFSSVSGILMYIENKLYLKN